MTSKDWVARFSQFISIKVMKINRKSHAQLRERLRRLRPMQKIGILSYKKEYVIKGKQINTVHWK